MKIVYFIEQTHLHGGIERVLSSKVNYLMDVYNAEVYLFTNFQEEKPHRYQMDENVKCYDLKMTYNRKKSYLSLENMCKFQDHFFRIQRLLSKINPDVIVVCSEGFEWYALPYIKQKALLVKEYHSSKYWEVYSSKRDLLKRLKRYTQKKYDYHVVLSDAEKKLFPKYLNLEVIPNACELNTLSDTSSRKKIAMCAVRIAPVKGLESLIKIWKNIHSAYPDWQLHIYGEGDIHYVTKLKQLIVKNGLQSIVFLKGASNEIHKKMNENAVYVMTSKTECFPMVLLEAMNCGMAILSYKCPNGPADILADGVDGVLVENQNANAFELKLRDVLSSETLRKTLGENARRNVKKYNQEQIMKQWWQLFQKKA